MRLICPMRERKEGLLHSNDEEETLFVKNQKKGGDRMCHFVRFRTKLCEIAQLFTHSVFEFALIINALKFGTLFVVSIIGINALIIYE